MDFSKWTPEYFLTNQDECLGRLQNENNWCDIPYLNYANLCDLRDNSLVRFRGVVQDMYNPEIYLDEFEVLSTTTGEAVRVQNGKYRDIPFLMPGETLNHDSDRNKLGDRKGYFVVTIPGINKWVEEIEKSKYPLRYNNDNPSDEIKSVAPKRTHPDENADEMEVDVAVEFQTNKKIKESDSKIANNKPTCLSPEFIVNSPIPSRPSRACMVKIYTESDEYELGNIIDVIGFLSVDPQLDGMKTGDDTENHFISSEEIQIQHPPPSLVPRLHAAYVKTITNYNPLRATESTSGDDDVDYTSEEDLKVIGKHLHVALTQCLFGDELAAEYLLCHLISSVYIRTEIKPLGQFTLNLSHLPQNLLETYPEKLYKIIEMLLPASHYFAATLDNLNTLQFFPKEDQTTNKLVSGHLQLAPHTHFVFDETKLTPGKLGESGLNAIKYFSHLIDSQQIKCIFQYFQTEYQCNIPILIISEVKSLLPKNFHVPLAIQYPESVEIIDETLKATEFFLQSKITRIRKYLSHLKSKRFTMPEGDDTVSKLIQNDFVRLRRDKNIDTDYLHNLMVLSRLIGLSSGRTNLDGNTWRRACELEVLREKRIIESQHQPK